MDTHCGQTPLLHSTPQDFRAEVGILDLISCKFLWIDSKPECFAHSHEKENSGAKATANWTTSKCLAATKVRVCYAKPTCNALIAQRNRLCKKKLRQRFARNMLCYIVNFELQLNSHESICGYFFTLIAWPGVRWMAHVAQHGRPSCH